MTDRDELKKLFDKFGIEYAADLYTVEATTGHDKVTGYTGFTATFNFEADGKFISLDLKE